jgi:hypothetical protein
MKKILLYIYLLAAMNIGALPQLYAQQWTEPINISNLGGYSMNIDMAIDHANKIHVVWDQKITSSHWLIMYTCSEDDGLTWSEPLDLLRNTDLWMLQPHIACDSKNNLYVTYTHNGLEWPPEGRLIKMLTYDGQTWSEPFIVSKEMPGSHYNKVVVDFKDNVYVFWGYYSSAMYYSFRESGNWSEIYCPYCDSADIFAFTDGHALSYNLIHWVGTSMSFAYYGERSQYYEYSTSSNQWTNPEIISSDTIVVDIDLALNNAETPVSAYRKKSTISVGVTSDSTMHTKKEGYFWSSPDLVSGTDKRQIGQQIAIDQNNDEHVVEIEYYNSSPSEGKLIHYSKSGKDWICSAIDSAIHMINYPKMIFSSSNLYVFYYKEEEVNNKGIWFSKYDIITNIKEEAKQTPELKIYPNPGSGIISIQFENSSRQLVDLSVYDFNGKLVSVLAHRMLPPGMQRFVWYANSTTGQKVKPGTYLVKLTKGDSSATQVVEIVK